MALHVGLVVDDGEDVLADKEDLGGRDVGDSKNDIARNLLRHHSNYYKQSGRSVHIEISFSSFKM